MTGEIDVSGVYGRAFALLGRNLGKFGPLALLLVALPNAWPIALGGLAPQGIGASVLGDAVGLVQLPILLLGLLYQLIVIAACLNDEEGGNAGLGTAAAVGLRMFLPALGAGILSWAVIFLGVVALIIPGVIAYCMFAVVFPVLIGERIGVLASLSRSRSLTESNRVTIFGVYFLLGCAQGIGGLILNLLVVTATSDLTARLLAGALVATIDALIRAPLSAAIYVELRSAKEGGLTDGLAQIFA